MQSRRTNASRGRGPESDVAADYGNAPTFSDTLGLSGEGDAVSSRLKASLGGSSARPRGTIGRGDRRPREIAIRPYYFGFPQFLWLELITSHLFLIA